VDAARAAALLGMACVHVLPVLEPDGSETVAGAVAAGRASALFAVLAGVGIALGTGGRRPPASARAHAAAGAGLLVRAALVLLLGLALIELDPPVAVVLPYYALLFAVAVPLLRLRAPVLAAAAAVWCVLGPALSHLLRAGPPRGPGEQPGFAALAAPGDLLQTLLLTGYYPVLPWTAYLLAGMAVGRSDLAAPRAAARLLVGGGLLAVAATAGSALLLGPGGGAAALGPALTRRRYGTTPTDSWWWLALEAPHTGTPFDLAHTTGTGLAVLGAALLVARFAPGLVWLPAAVGSVPLTLYSLHVTALALDPPPPGQQPRTLVVHVVVALGIGALLRAAGRRGPLEAAVGAAARAARTAVGGSGRDGEHRGQPEPGDADPDPQRPAGQPPGQGRPEPGADEQAGRHRRHGRPVHGAEQREAGRGDGVGQAEQHVLQGVPPQQRDREPDQQQREHEHPRGGAEVARVDRHREQAGQHPGPGAGPVAARRGPPLRGPAQAGLQQQHHGRRGDEAGHDPGERPGRGEQEQPGPGGPAEHDGRGQPAQGRPLTGQLGAAAGRGADRGRGERDGVGDVRGRGREPRDEQRRVGEQRREARDRAGHPGREPGGEQQQRRPDGHGRRGPGLTGPPGG
jgi:hypothetical protein